MVLMGSSCLLHHGEVMLSEHGLGAHHGRTRAERVLMRAGSLNQSGVSLASLMARVCVASIIVKGL